MIVVRQSFKKCQTNEDEGLIISNSHMSPPHEYGALDPIQQAGGEETPTPTLTVTTAH